MAFTADRGDAGERLDRAISRRVPASLVRSRTRAQALIASGAVEINGRVVQKGSARLAQGDRVSVALGSVRTREPLLPQALGLDVIFEDEWLVAVNKPAGLIVHPSYKHPDGTLVNALLWHVRTADPASEAPRLLHRLDKWTSGVIVAAKTASSHGALLHAMRAAGARKIYLAVTYGRPRRSTGVIRIALGRDASDRRRIVPSHEGGRESITRYECLARSSGPRRGLSLLRCHLVTGRMHQIRVHLSASGWPIVGDPLYGRSGWEAVRDPTLADVARHFARQALHARRLDFVHPFTGRAVSITASMPDDLRALIEASGLDSGLDLD